MTKPWKTALIVASGAISTGIISATSYVIGKRNGLREAAEKQAANELNAGDPVRNQRTPANAQA